MKSRIRQRRTWIALLLAGLVCWFLYPVIRVSMFFLVDQVGDDRNLLLTKETIDDASGLNAVSHKGIVTLTSDLEETEKILRGTLSRAREQNLHREVRHAFERW